MLPKWVSEITIENLPEDFQTLAEDIGLGNTLKVMLHFEGSEKYFPKIDNCLKGVRDKIIRKRWRKHNIHHLAKEFDLTNNQIRHIVNDHEDQLDLAL